MRARISHSFISPFFLRSRSERGRERRGGREERLSKALVTAAKDRSESYKSCHVFAIVPERCKRVDRNACEAARVAFGRVR